MAGVTNFASLRVDELKKILSDRGIPCAGKTKEELRGLVEKGWCRYEVKEGCDHEESERKRRRVVGDDGYVIDLNGRSVEWTTSLKDCPSLSLGDVFAYLIKSCQWTPERLTKFKDDDGYLMFVDNHVETVVLGLIDGVNTHVFVKGSVMPEQRQTAQRYHTWLLLNSRNSEVISAGCECVAA